MPPVKDHHCHQQNAEQRVLCFVVVKFKTEAGQGTDQQAEHCLHRGKDEGVAHGAP